MAIFRRIWGFLKKNPNFQTQNQKSRFPTLGNCHNLVVFGAWDFADLYFTISRENRQITAFLGKDPRMHQKWPFFDEYGDFFNFPNFQTKNRKFWYATLGNCHNLVVFGAWDFADPYFTMPRENSQITAFLGQHPGIHQKWPFFDEYGDFEILRIFRLKIENFGVQR